jgi:hypothetical protein
LKRIGERGRFIVGIILKTSSTKRFSRNLIKRNQQILGGMLRSDLFDSFVKPALVSFIFIFLWQSSACAQNANKPFPQHTVYTKGCIKPSNYTQAEMDSATARFYHQWKKHYITDVPDKNECYVFCNADGNWRGGNKSAHSVSLSEGHGYGMMITAMMGGYDQEAQSIFDRLLAYFKDHPSNINHKLMAWNQRVDTTTTEKN